MERNQVDLSKHQASLRDSATNLKIKSGFNMQQQRPGIASLKIQVRPIYRKLYETLNNRFRF